MPDRAPTPQSSHDATANLTEIAAAVERLYRAGRLTEALAQARLGDDLLAAGSPGTVLPREAAQHMLLHGRLLVAQVFYANSATEPALRVLEQARDRAEAAGDERSVAAALAQTGQALYNSMLLNQMLAGTAGGADYDRPLALFQQALARQEALDDWRGAAESLFYSGLMHECKGQRDTAHDYYSRVVAIADEHGCRLEKSYAVRHLGGLALDAGDAETALRHFEESLALREELGYTLLLPLSHLAVADARRAKGDAEQAAAHEQRAYDLARGMDAPFALIFSALALGAVQQRRGDRDAARGLFQEAHTVAEHIGFAGGVTAARQVLDALPA